MNEEKPLVSLVTNQELREIIDAVRKVKDDSGWGRVIRPIEKGRIKSIEYAQSKLITPETTQPIPVK